MRLGEHASEPASQESQERASWGPRASPGEEGLSGRVAGGGSAAEEPPRRDPDVAGLRTGRSQSPSRRGRQPRSARNESPASQVTCLKDDVPQGDMLASDTFCLSAHMSAVTLAGCPPGFVLKSSSAEEMCKSLTRPLSASGGHGLSVRCVRSRPEGSCVSTSPAVTWNHHDVTVFPARVVVLISTSRPIVRYPEFRITGFNEAAPWG